LLALGVRAHAPDDQPGHGTLTTIVRDVTDVEQAGRALARVNRALRVIGTCSDALVRARDEGELLRSVCRIAVEVGGYPLAWVGYAEHDPARTVRPVAAAGQEAYVAEIQVTWAEDVRGQGPVGTAIRSASPTVIQSVAEDPRFEPWRQAAARYGFGSVLALPLRRNGTAFGALAIYAAEPDAFDARETELLAKLARNLAYGILALRTADEQRRADAERREALRLLRQRVKELTVIRETARLLDEHRGSDAELLQAVAAVLSAGWQHDDIAAARVALDGLEARTPGFAETPWMQRAAWRLADGRAGVVEIAYLEEQPREADGPFLAGEQDLIATLADMLRTHFERRRAEDALRRSEARFRALIENAEDIITVLDGRGVILYESPSIEHVLGYRPDELVGTSAFQWLHPEDHRKVGELFTRSAEHPGLTGAIEFRFRHKDGSWRVLHGVGKNCLDDPAVGGVVVNSRDITDRKQAEQEMAKQRDALLQSEKLAAMSALLAGVAHELNNPLAVVVGRAALLGQQLAGGPLEAPVGKLVQAAERCARIVKNFLALARQYPPERQTVRLNQIVQEALELMAYALRVDNVEVVLDLELGQPALWADPHQLHQVVVNLVSNAHHAMREIPPPHPRRLTLRSRADAERGRVTLEVTDTGPGIPPEVRSRLFEPFFTTKPIGQGTGLGLSLCRGIVEGHGGQITLESEPGRGATFRVELPIQAAPGPAQERRAAPAEAVARDRRILVVDDEPEVARLVADVLEREGQHVEMAADGRAALEKLRRDDFDLIVSDIKMPELDGPGLYREVARLRPELARRMVFLTGDTLGPEPQRFLKDAGALWVNKPFSPDEVRQVVGRALGLA
jgi:PAS domain S-box-containing protein